jgi:LPS sulfotransferase NodH
MRTALNYLLESENAGDVLAFLRGRGPRAHIIAPNWVRDRVVGEKLASRGRHAASWSEHGAGGAHHGENATNFLVVAEDAEQEQAIISSLNLRKGAKVYGLFSHVVPALLCSLNGMAPGLPTSGLKRYAMLCIPRSGSRYLSAVLSNRGVGAPREHIREPLAHIIGEGKLGFAGAIDALERFGQKNGIFGTKLISTFLIRASQRHISDVKANVSWLTERGYRLMRLNRPLNDAVISSYIAYQMRKWHFFGAMDVDTRARLDSLEFEDGAAWDEYIRFRAENVIVDAVAGWFDIPSIPYSEIESNIEGVVSELCSLIGVDSASLKPGSAPVPIPTRSGSPTYVIFEERLSALLDRRAADIDSSTVKKLRAIGKLSQKAAEDIVAESA